MDEEVHPQVKQVAQETHGFQGAQVPIGVQGNEVPVVLPEIINGDIREYLISLDGTFTT